MPDSVFKLLQNAIKQNETGQFYSLMANLETDSLSDDDFLTLDKLSREIEDSLHPDFEIEDRNVFFQKLDELSKKNPIYTLIKADLLTNPNRSNEDLQRRFIFLLSHLRENQIGFRQIINNPIFRKNSEIIIQDANGQITFKTSEISNIRKAGGGNYGSAFSFRYLGDDESVLKYCTVIKDHNDQIILDDNQKPLYYLVLKEPHRSEFGILDEKNISTFKKEQHVGELLSATAKEVQGKIDQRESSGFNLVGACEIKQQFPGGRTEKLTPAIISQFEYYDIDKKNQPIASNAFSFLSAMALHPEIEDSDIMLASFMANAKKVLDKFHQTHCLHLDVSLRNFLMNVKREDGQIISLLPKLSDYGYTRNIYEDHFIILELSNLETKSQEKIIEILTKYQELFPNIQDIITKLKSANADDPLFYVKNLIIEEIKNGSLPEEIKQIDTHMPFDNSSQARAKGGLISYNDDYFALKISMIQAIAMQGGLSLEEIFRDETKKPGNEFYDACLLRRIESDPESLQKYFERCKDLVANPKKYSLSDSQKKIINALLPLLNSLLLTEKHSTKDIDLSFEVGIKQFIFQSLEDKLSKPQIDLKTFLLSIKRLVEIPLNPKCLSSDEKEIYALMQDIANYPYGNFNSKEFINNISNNISELKNRMNIVSVDPQKEKISTPETIKTNSIEQAKSGPIESPTAKDTATKATEPTEPKAEPNGDRDLHYIRLILSSKNNPEKMKNHLIEYGNNNLYYLLLALVNRFTNESTHQVDRLLQHLPPNFFDASFFKSFKLESQDIHEIVKELSTDDPMNPGKKIFDSLPKALQIYLKQQCLFFRGEPSAEELTEVLPKNYESNLYEKIPNNENKLRCKIKYYFIDQSGEVRQNEAFVESDQPTTESIMIKKSLKTDHEGIARFISKNLTNALIGEQSTSSAPIKAPEFTDLFTFLKIEQSLPTKPFSGFLLRKKIKASLTKSHSPTADVMECRFKGFEKISVASLLTGDSIHIENVGFPISEKDLALYHYVRKLFSKYGAVHMLNETNIPKEYTLSLETDEGMKLIELIMAYSKQELLLAKGNVAILNAIIAYQEIDRRLQGPLQKVDDGSPSLEQLENSVSIDGEARLRFGAVKHFGRFPKELMVNLPYAEELIRQSREDLNPIISKSIETIQSEYELTSILSFAKKAGMKVGSYEMLLNNKQKDEEIIKNELIKNLEVFLNFKMKARQASLKQLAMEIKLSNAIGQDLQFKTTNGKSEIDTLINENPLFFLKGKFVLRGENQATIIAGRRLQNMGKHRSLINKINQRISENLPNLIQNAVKQSDPHIIEYLLLNKDIRKKIDVNFLKEQYQKILFQISDHLNSYTRNELKAGGDTTENINQIKKNIHDKVIKEIIEESSIPHRVLVVERWVKLMEIAKARNDHLTVSAIHSALTESPIKDLKATHKGLSFNSRVILAHPTVKSEVAFLVAKTDKPISSQQLIASLREDKEDVPKIDDTVIKVLGVENANFSAELKNPHNQFHPIFAHRAEEARNAILIKLTDDLTELSNRLQAYIDANKKSETDDNQKSDSKNSSITNMN